jgi:hypothetical protein
MNTINQVNASNAGTLAQPLQSAVFVPLAKADESKVASGHTLQVLKKRGDNSRIAESLAIEVPEFKAIDVQLACQLYPALVDKFIATLYAEQREILFTLAAKGGTVHYADISLAAVAANCKPVTSGKLSKESIVNWYNSVAAEVVSVVLAERFGLADKDELSAVELDKIEQVSNAVRDNLATLASPNAKPEARVKQSLQLMLDAIEASGRDESSMVTRLNARLNPAAAVAKADSLADMLGM